MFNGDNIMNLCVFNPEHDIALAHGSRFFTAPRAGRQLRADLGFLSVLWAGEGDYVLVADREKAEYALRQLGLYKDGVTLVEVEDLRKAALRIDRVCPWGWDAALKNELQRLGVALGAMPSDECLENCRQLSHRKWSQYMLRQIRCHLSDDRLVGKSVLLDNELALCEQLKLWPLSVLKAPWSSSGRGVRFVDGGATEAIMSWAVGIMRQQGALMVEPFYDKVQDFGMEFMADGHSVSYVGLSIFGTRGSAYTGNMLASEEDKLAVLSRYINIGLLDKVRDALCVLFSKELFSAYVGPLGVDMMIVRGDECVFCVHPCVEVNLRMTMGHVAIKLSSRLSSPFSSMRIEYAGGHYHLNLL